MIKTRNPTESFFLFAFGIMLTTGSFLVKYQFVSQIIHYVKYQERTGVISLFMLIYAVLFFITGAFSVYFSSKGVSLKVLFVERFKEVIGFIRNFFLDLYNYGFSPTEKIWITGAIITGLIIRAYYVAAPMRADESATFYYFVQGPLYKSFIYLEPNNHVLHTLFARFMVDVFGNNQFALRFPAFITGVLCIPLIFIANQRLNGRKSGYVSMMLMAIFPVILIFDTMARGYSLVNFFMLTGVIIGNSMINENTFSRTLMFALNSALGIFVMPTFLFPAFGLYLWVGILLLKQESDILRILRSFVIPSLIMLVLFTFLLYTPVMLVTNNFDKLFSNSTIKPLQWKVFLHLTPNHLRHSLTFLFSDIKISLKILSGVIFISGVIWLSLKRKFKLLLLMSSFMIGAVILYLAKRSIPFPRTWIYLFPVMFMVADAGVSFLFFTQKKRFRQIFQGMVFTFMIATGIFLINTDTVTNSHYTETFHEAKPVAAFLSATIKNGDTLQMDHPVGFPVRYYLIQNKVVLNNSPDSNYLPKRYFVIKKKQNELIDQAHQNPVKIFELGEAEIYMAARDTSIKNLRLE